MLYNVYSVYDVKTGYNTPFTDVNDDSAARGFGYAFKNGNNIYNYAPEDFRLYRIGTYDSDTGVLNACVPQFVCEASSFVRGVVDEK